MSSFSPGVITSGDSSATFVVSGVGLTVTTAVLLEPGVTTCSPAGVGVSVTSTSVNVDQTELLITVGSALSPGDYSVCARLVSGDYQKVGTTELVAGSHYLVFALFGGLSWTSALLLPSLLCFLPSPSSTHPVCCVLCLVSSCRNEECHLLLSSISDCK